MAKVYVCPVTKREFMDKAPLVKMTLAFEDGSKQVFVLTPHAFSTGSFGWYLNSKAHFLMDNVDIGIQLNTHLVVMGSKDAPRG